MKKYLFSALAVAAIGGVAYVTLPGATPDPAAPAPQEGEALVSITVPQTLSDRAAMGERAFDAVCAACHGANATGRWGFGPPLVHRIDEPSHHGDIAFLLAARQGVRAHHWRFGDMPPQPQVTKGEVEDIIAYVRELQRANGID